MQLTKSSFSQVVNISNQTADKNKAVWREITGTMSRKQEQRLGTGQAEGGDEGKAPQDLLSRLLEIL